ncbi:MAG: peptidoglycan bridge formation glycyltransferase FemA/FemB family protein [bacterium]|nr:peptidoglycan bridge formation glycyltransferase FemA/FemB family protein [bacterium]
MNLKFKIREATDQDSENWDKFVEHNNGSFYQCYKWRFVYKEQGVKTFYLIAHDEKDNIAGIFPFVKISMFLNDSIHSMPHGGTYGGLLSRSSEVKTALMKRMDEICLKENVVYTHILMNPHMDNSELIKCLGSVGYKPRYTAEKSPKTFVLNTQDYKTIWDELFNTKVRNQVRKAAKNGVEIIRNDRDMLAKYYFILIENRKKLKTKIMQKEVFYKILDLFQEHTKLYLAVYKRKLIAGAYCFDFQNIRYLFDNVSIPEYMKYCPNNLLYSEMIRDACDNSSIDKFDFGGTTPNSSHFHWKKQYGGTPMPLQYYEKVYSPAKKFLREKTVRPRVIIRKLIWSKLVSQEQANKMSSKTRKFLEWF